MSINIIVYLLFLIGAYIYSNRKDDKARRNFIIFCSLVLVLKAALRSVTVGPDTSHYSGYFYDSMHRSWDETLFMLFNLTDINEYESGYRLVEKVFSTFIPNFNLYTFFAQSILFYWPLGGLMYKETKTIRELLFGYVLFNALFMGLPMSNARQVYALGFCIWSYMSLVNNRYILATLFMLLGYSIHHSALLFSVMIIIPFLPYKIMKNSVWAFFAAIPIIFEFVNQIIFFMGSFIGSEKYSNYSEDSLGGAYTYIILSLILCLFAAIALSKCQEPDKKKKLYYAIVGFTTLFVPLIYSNGTMMRITEYFQVFFVLLLPKLLEVLFIRRQERDAVYILLIAFLIILSVATEMPYKFFWQENQDPYINWT